MRRRFLLLAAGVVLFGAASIAVILLVGGGAGSSDASPPLSRPETAPLPLPPPGAVVVEPRPIPPPEPAPPPLPPPPAGSWDAVRVAPQRGTVAAAITQELQPAVGECFDEDVQARWGPQGGRHTTVDYGAMDDLGEPVVLLQIETFADGIQIVDAPVETRGRASDGLLACAQAALRGKQVEVPGTSPGQRYRMRWPIVP